MRRKYIVTIAIIWVCSALFVGYQHWLYDNFHETLSLDANMYSVWTNYNSPYRDIYSSIGKYYFLANNNSIDKVLLLYQPKGQSVSDKTQRYHYEIQYAKNIKRAGTITFINNITNISINATGPLAAYLNRLPDLPDSSAWTRVTSFRAPEQFIFEWCSTNCVINSFNYVYFKYLYYNAQFSDQATIEANDFNSFITYYRSHNLFPPNYELYTRNNNIYQFYQSAGSTRISLINYDVFTIVSLLHDRRAIKYLYYEFESGFIGMFLQEVEILK